MIMQDEIKNRKHSNSFINYIIGGNKLEIGVILFFAISYIVVTIFHEPWFDEAQAWQIARCASLKDILFTIPHYEGHPALWHLLLFIPAKLGLPFEISLKVIGGLLILLCVYLVEYKSPFKRWFKLLLPFTFFFFYQYGVIVRPYSLLLVLVILAAMFFKGKNDKPFRFVVVLIAMCCTSALGIIIAGGIAISWVIDIISEQGIKETMKSLFTTKRMLSLWLLLFSALFVCFQVLPKNDKLATNFVKKNSFIERFVCSLFAFLPDSFLTESPWSSGENLLIDIKFNIGELIAVSCLGIFIWFLIWLLSNKKKFKYFSITYTLFALFSALVYFNAHHIGIVLYIILFWAWINFSEKETDYRILKIKSMVEKKSENKEWLKGIFKPETQKSIKKLVTFIEVIIVCLSVYWSISSSILDIKIQYNFGREAANYIKENHLENLTIFSEWGYSEDSTEGKVHINDVYYMHIPVNIYPYFDDEIVDNMERGYVTHIYSDEEACERIIDQWRELGEPDIMLGYVDLKNIYGENIKRTDYSPVFRLETNIIWRGSEYIAYNYIFARNDIIEQYNLISLYDEIHTNE